MREVGEVAGQVARWLGIFSSGLIVGMDAERALERAERVLGRERLVELRAWFAQQSPEALEVAKAAVVEACISIVLADARVADSERELLEQIVFLSELGDATRETLVARIESPPALESIVSRIEHPALRELALVMAWQLALADGKADPSEYGAYGVLADRMGIAPARAQELRALFRDER